MNYTFEVELDEQPILSLRATEYTITAKVPCEVLLDESSFGGLVYHKVRAFYPYTTPRLPKETVGSCLTVTKEASEMSGYKDVLRESLDKFFVADTLSSRTQRKMESPTFPHPVVKEYRKTLRQLVEERIAQWKYEHMRWES